MPQMRAYKIVRVENTPDGEIMVSAYLSRYSKYCLTYEVGKFTESINGSGIFVFVSFIHALNAMQGLKLSFPECKFKVYSADCEEKVDIWKYIAMPTYGVDEETAIEQDKQVDELFPAAWHNTENYKFPIGDICFKRIKLVRDFTPIGFNENEEGE